MKATIYLNKYRIVRATGMFRNWFPNIGPRKTEYVHYVMYEPQVGENGIIEVEKIYSWKITLKQNVVEDLKRWHQSL